MFDALLDRIEDLVNDMSDKDWSWWPFLWLRPAREARLSLRRSFVMTALYGLPLALVLCVGFRLTMPRAHAEQAALVALVSVPLAFLFHLSVVIGPMWNRRAERLARRRTLRS